MPRTGSYRLSRYSWAALSDADRYAKRSVRRVLYTSGWVDDFRTAVATVRGRQGFG